MFYLNAYFYAEFAEHSQVVAATHDTLAKPFMRLVEVCTETVRGGGKLMLFDNGGSAADAQHLATGLTVRYVQNGEPLTTDTSALTAVINDFSFDQVLARQISVLGKRDDVAVGVSTSGRSANVIQALRVARELGIVPAAFGRDGGDLAGATVARVLLADLIPRYSKTATIKRLNAVGDVV